MAKEPKVKKKRVRNPVETRARLLRATMELVIEKAAAALSLKEAAHRANLSRAVAYLHFEDRDQLLHEATAWTSEGLQAGVKRFERGATIRDGILYNTKLILTHPEASKLMITAAMAGADLDRQHPLYKLILNMLKDLKDSGNARNDVDLEILTYIMFGMIASALMLGSQRETNNIDQLAQRFANEWAGILERDMFHAPPNRQAA
jgi:AcrR family transcriptional regulator